MENQIEIVKDIAEGMIGIGGIPSNEEFYAEFDMRVRAALRIHAVSGQSEQLVCPDCAEGRDPFEPEWKCPECRRKDEAR